MNGYEFRELLFRDENLKCKYVPFIFRSTIDSDEEINHTFDIGSVGYFIKGTGIDEMRKNKATTVSITSPANNASFIAPANVKINALASDADGSVYSVKFYNGTTYLKTVYTSPYTYTLSNLPAGTYSITAKATDNAGAQTVSAAITVKVSAPSIVSNKPALLNTPISVSKDVSVSLAPNPAANILNVYTSGFASEQPITISVISVSGVIMKTVKSMGSVKKIHVDVSSIKSGVYAIRVVSGDKIISKQFVKL